MSASASTRREKKRNPSSPPPETNARRGWIGVDFSGDDGPRRARKLLPLLILALITALGIAALRIDLIRTRYALAAAMNTEGALIETQRKLIVRRRQLRDPIELAIQARLRGFRPPTHVVVLREPTTRSTGLSEANHVIIGQPAQLPAVAAGPPNKNRQAGWR